MNGSIVHINDGVKFTTGNIPTGMKFGRTTVIEKIPNPTKDNHAFYRCACDCGKIYCTVGRGLVSGHTTSCGCYFSEQLIARNTIHGEGSQKHANRGLYCVWNNMMKRCYNTKNPGYYNWGGRGITVCDEWKADYTVFRDWAFANGYKKHLSLDRRDNLLGYSPSNCWWATSIQQNRNTRKNVNVTAFGETKCISAWVADDCCSVGHTAIRKRIKKGWSPEDAITTPAYGRRATLTHTPA